MQILVVMAGAGSRFEEVGYPLPKPLIEVNDKHIIEWTTRSLPFIDHYSEDTKQNITFAIRSQDQEKFQMKERLKKIYGNKIDIISFDEMTRGNLETAFIASKKFDDDEEILILDSDNHYDGSNLENFIDVLKMKENLFSLICTFEPIDNSHKWCFAIKQGSIVRELLEKDKNAISKGGKPMVGVFYFSKKSIFDKIARFILSQNEMVNNEFFMSQSIQACIDLAIPVYGHKVENVIPLGTPEDIIKVRENEYKRIFK